MRQTFLLLLFVLFPLAASADDVEIGGLYYYLKPNEKVAEVTGMLSKEYAGAVEIPASVEYEGITYDVTSISSCAFSFCELSSVTIPNSVTSIDYMAFSNVAA